MNYISKRNNSNKRGNFRNNKSSMFIDERKTQNDKGKAQSIFEQSEKDRHFYVGTNNRGPRKDEDPNVKERVMNAIKNIFNYEITVDMFWIKIHPMLSEDMKKGLVLAHYVDKYAQDIPKVRGLIFDTTDYNLVLDSEGKSKEYHDINSIEETNDGTSSYSWADNESNYITHDKDWKNLGMYYGDLFDNFYLSEEPNQKYQYFSINPNYEGVVLRVFKYGGVVIYATYRNILALETFTLVNNSIDTTVGPRIERNLKAMLLDAHIITETLESQLFKTITDDSETGEGSNVEYDEIDNSSFAYIFILITPEFTKVSNRNEFANTLVLIDVKCLNKSVDISQDPVLIESFEENDFNFSISNDLKYHCARLGNDPEKFAEIKKERIVECNLYSKLLFPLNDKNEKGSKFTSGDSFVITERNRDGSIKQVNNVFSPGYSYKLKLRNITGKDRITNELEILINAFEIFERDYSRKMIKSIRNNQHLKYDSFYERIITNVSDNLDENEIFFLDINRTLSVNYEILRQIMGNGTSKCVTISDIRTNIKNDDSGSRTRNSELANVLINMFLAFSSFHQRNIIENKLFNIVINLYSDLANGLIKMSEKDLKPITFSTWKKAEEYLENRNRIQRNSNEIIPRESKYKIIKLTPVLFRLIEETKKDKKLINVVNNIKREVIKSNNSFLFELWKAQKHFNESGDSAVFQNKTGIDFSTINSTGNSISNYNKPNNRSGGKFKGKYVKK